MVVDAAILVAATFGRSDPIVSAQQQVILIVTERALEEARRRIALGAQRPDLLGTLDAITRGLTVVPEEEIAPLIPDCETTLREAVASCNGSTDDAHVLALAWAASADVWTTDRDFAGTGVASWSTSNLLRALREG
jgi:predicted nucleic acid-binding protein